VWSKVSTVTWALVCLACYAWRVDPPAPETVAPRFSSRVIRLTLVDGERLELFDPSVSHDTLRAWRPRGPESGSPLPFSVPVSQIRLVESRHLKPGRTAAFVVFVVLPATSLVVGVIWLSELCGGGGPGC
jgi:hypothetical protein